MLKSISAIFFLSFVNGGEMNLSKFIMNRRIFCSKLFPSWCGRLCMYLIGKIQLSDKSKFIVCFTKLMVSGYLGARSFIDKKCNLRIFVTAEVYN